MNVPTISAVAMAAMTLVVGCWHLLLWSRRRELHAHMSFGLACLSVSFYDAMCAGLYQAQSWVEGARWQAFQSLGLALGAVSFCWFVFDYTSAHDRRPPTLLTVAHAPTVLALALGQRQWLWTGLDATKSVDLPLVGVVTYREAAPGILADYQTILGLLVFGYAFYAAARMVRRGERARGLPLLLATALFFAGAVNDSAIELGLYSFVYVIEYSFLGLVLLMTNAITHEVLRAQTLSAALVTSEERYRQFVEGTEDLVIRFTQDGSLLFANHSAERVLGLSPAAAAGKPVLEFIHDDDRARTLKMLALAVAEGGRHATIENRVVTASGEVRDVLWTVHFQLAPSGRVVALNAIGRDISRRKRAEQGLQESEQAYQALVESALQAVAVFDGPRYVFVNSRMTEIFGWSREEFLAMSAEQAAQIVHPDDREMVIERRMARQAGRAPPSVYEFRVVRQDGAVRWVQVFANAIQYRGRHCSLAVYVDITDRQEAEAARQQAETDRARLEAQLRHAQKMEAVGLLAGGVAHDFNNLLQAIVGYTQLARRLVDDTAPARKHLEQVLAASDRAASLTRQLLAFSRTEAMQPRPVQMNDLIADLMKMLRRVLGEQIELSVRTLSDVGVALVDHGQIEQVLMNLCINARDAMPQGGRIGIETSRARLDEQFCAQHPWASPRDYVVLTVTDTGEGIPAEIRDRIFEPFFTTKEVGKGTGLGLATVYAIVERHGGGVTVDSEVGHGSRFRVFLPASDRTDSESPVASTDPAILGGSETILVAEDDEVVRTLATTVLQEAGYRLVVAKDGDEAIRLMHENAQDIALAVVDVVMPGKGGIEVRDAIRSSGNKIPILFSTGYSPGAERRRSPSLGGDPVLLKPYQPSVLLRTVRRLLDDKPPEDVTACACWSYSSAMSDRATGGSGSHAAVAAPASTPRRRIYSLVVHGKEIFLRVGTHTIGRALSCDVVLNDRLVSREHARIVVRDASAAVVDLGSTNGVYVNENRVQGSEEVRDGDLIVIGSQEMTLRAVVSDDERTTSPGLQPDGEPIGEISEVIEREPPPPSGRFPTGVAESGPQDALKADVGQLGVLRASLGSIHTSDSRHDSGPHLTEKADAILVMGRLADRAMVMGNYEAAEHVLQGHLDALLVAARGDVVLPDTKRETASRYALRLAEALQKPVWIDFAVELHLIAGKPMSEWCTTRMMVIVPGIPGIDVEQLFFYQQMLKGRLDQMPPEERLLAEQIVGLKPKQ